MATDNRNQGILNGLKAALVFLICFKLLRYDNYLSLLFAGVGGVSLGIVISWWQSKEPPQPKHDPFEKLPTIELRRRYPGLKDLSVRAAQRSRFSKKKSPEDSPED